MAAEEEEEDIQRRCDGAERPRSEAEAGKCSVLRDRIASGQARREERDCPWLWSKSIPGNSLAVRPRLASALVRTASASLPSKTVV